MQATKTKPTQTHNGQSETQRIRKAYAMEISRNSGLSEHGIQGLVKDVPDKIRTQVMRMAAWYGKNHPEAIIRTIMAEPEKMIRHFQTRAGSLRSNSE